MSNLLEEAIVDAKALKEAAMKTAEKSIVEKYSDEVRDQISKILEVEMSMDNAASPNPLEKIPLAALDGEVDTDDAEEVTIDLSDLADLATSDSIGAEDMESTELSLGQIAQASGEQEDADIAGLDAGDELANEDDISEEDTLSQIILALQEEVNEDETKAKEMDAPEQHKMPKMEDVEPIQRAQDLEEEREKEEEDVVKAKEKEEDERDDLNETDLSPDQEKKMDKDDDGDIDADDLKSLRQKNESMNLTNEFTKLQESINTLGRDNKKLKTSNGKIVEENSKLKDTLQSLNEVFEDLLLHNAQLVYTNKVLEVSSLNERQKEKIVGAIRESKSAEQAKVVFETLQNAVGQNESKGPQSINEVFSKNGTKMISRKETNNETEMPVASRWKTLAGIK
jgi:hypothetical protein